MSRPQIIVIKLEIKEMHFKNVNHWVHALYKKILNMFTLSKDYLTSSIHYFIFTVICADGELAYDVLPPQHLPIILISISAFQTAQIPQQRHVYVMLVAVNIVNFLH